MEGKQDGGREEERLGKVWGAFQETSSAGGWALQRTYGLAAN